MPPARPIFQRAARAGKSAVFWVAGALAGAGLYAANLAYLNAQTPATLIASLPVPGLTSVALSPNGEVLAAGGNPGWRGTVILWDTTDPARPVKTGQISNKAERIVNQVAFTPQGLATDNSNTVTLWKAPDTIPAKPPEPRHPLTPKDYAALIANGQVSSTSHPTDTITLCNAADPSHPVTLRKPTRFPARERPPSAAFTPDGETLAFATGDGKVTLRNTNDPAHPLSRPDAISTNGDWVQSMAFFPNGRTLVTASFNNTVTLWNVTSPAHPVKLSRPLTGTGTVTTTKHDHVTETSNNTNTSVSLVAVSPDGTTLAVCNSDGTITLWNVTDPAQPVQIGRPINANANVNSVAFTPDGETLVTGSFNGTPGADSQVKIWRL